MSISSVVSLGSVREHPDHVVTEGGDDDLDRDQTRIQESGIAGCGLTPFSITLCKFEVGSISE